MTLHGTLHLHPAHVVGPVRRRTFGSFVEHMARCVHTGIHEPGHPSADADGLRTDVLDLTRELGVSTVRYPGGNFVSGYRWEDGVGPIEERPVRRDLAWHSTETNAFGLDEFMTWVERAGVEPMYAINLGTRGVPEALDVLEYATGAPGTELADRRAANGHPEPYPIRMWCLGNEMDGPWQLGHRPAADYARLAAEAARAMRRADPDLELVACGSSHASMPTFPAWEQAVLEAGYDEVDMVSAHVYYGERDGDRASYLAVADDLDAYLDAVAATVDHVRALRRGDKRVMISVDEWNVTGSGQGDAGEEPSGADWPVAPRFAEVTYTAQDAVIVGSLLICLLRHTDRVASASQAQLVNVLGPIRTVPGGAAWRQTIFHPFALTSRHVSGEVLRVAIDTPRAENARFGESAVLDAVATWDAEAGQLVVLAVNRSVDQELALEVPLTGFAGLELIEAVALHEEDPYATNTAEDPDRVVARVLEGARVEGGGAEAGGAEVAAAYRDDPTGSAGSDAPGGSAGRASGPRLTATLPPTSWAMFRLGRRG
ncbi:alpha-L-arabinofuranosidase C-terminal domain-containing protein [Brachybacterium sp. J144]|uniref:alpha-N-arabinofuranosidase n=1 Tax=Brachybacterium sp. J144 TaxID=3116487 RepID=UPI002E77046E|nr:alpha-L-arabinofuranosidase C-terminal domain-containing protein [Brachybacterium sp. J144]MEE1650328.1 alpha-L-arabinofuranosidase C-terminal domain-containing protein [Brachybacterium sp. J144]